MRPTPNVFQRQLRSILLLAFAGLIWCLPAAGQAVRPSPLVGALDPADGSWAAVPPPAGRYGHSSIYDPVRDRMVVFGGWDDYFRNDVWALSLSGSPVWTQLVPNGEPPQERGGHTAIYDPVRDRMLVFGGIGETNTRQNDVWALSLSGNPTWTLLAPIGIPPSARHLHTAIYDPVRDQMVVFGGGLLNDVWVLSLSGSPAWTQLDPAGTKPSGRGAHSAVYDQVRDRMVVFGGSDGTSRNDVWALSLSGSPAWTQLSPSGTKPTGRLYHTSIYDPVRDRMVMFGGYDSSACNDVWALSLAGSPAWTKLAPTGTLPAGQQEHTAFYDPPRDRMVVFGSDSISDMWALSLSGVPAWTPLVLTGSPPSARLYHTAIYDPVRDRVVIFGGSFGSYDNGVWALSLSGNPTWTQLAPTGTPPGGRNGHTAVYDPVRDRMVVFGGSNGSLLNDVWALSLAGSPVWTKLAPAGTPPSARYEHTALYDPVRDRMVMFGGWDGTLRNDVWTLSLSGSPAWTQLAPSGARPGGRQDHTAIYDPVRDRMVVFGGIGGVYLNDVWTLSLSGSTAWTSLAPGGAAPSGRHGHTALYDPVRDRMVVFAGYDGSFNNEVWALSLPGSSAWTQRDPVGTLPSPQYGHTAIYDPIRDQMAIFGMFNGSSAWTLTWKAAVAGVSDLEPTGIEFSAPRPNPSRAKVTLEFALPAPSDVSITVHDIVGRLVRKVVDRRFVAGRHSVEWDRRDRAGHILDSGIYFVRLEVPGRALVRKSVLIH